MTVDARSADMLTEMQRLLPFTITPTQGSYSGGVGASAGTHDGGGAIDLAGESLTSSQRGETETVGRMVGWAMWVRSPSQGNWPWHIHGIAVACGDLSSSAAGQVDDYMAGRNGLASGAPDTGNRDYVGVTWESYSEGKEVEDMTPEQANQLANVEKVVNWINGWKDQINPHVIDGTYQRAGWINEWKDGIDPVIRLTAEQVASLVADA